MNYLIMNKATTNQTPNQNPSESNWIFIPVTKELIAKRTDKYVLIKLPCGRSAILNSVFLRKKETEQKVFLSIPEDYEITFRRTRYNPTAKKFEIVDEVNSNARELLDEIKYYNQCVKEGHETAEILDFDFNPLPFDK